MLHLFAKKSQAKDDTKEIEKMLTDFNVFTEDIRKNGEWYELYFWDAKDNYKDLGIIYDHINFSEIDDDEWEEKAMIRVKI